MKVKPRTEPNTSRAWWLTAIVVVSLALTALTTPVPAQTSCPANPSTQPDADSDGYLDVEETNGFVLPDGTTFPGSNSGLARSTRLDPNSPDLFVVMQLANPSNFPAAPLALVAGLGVTVHVITADQAGLNLQPANLGFQLSCLPQRFVTLVESLDTNGTVVGSAEQGIPTTGFNIATVFSQRIVNHIVSTKGFADSATIQSWIKHTAAHEISHLLFRETQYVRRYGGYHHKTGDNKIMDQSIRVDGTTYLIPDSYGAEDTPGSYR